MLLQKILQKILAVVPNSTETDPMSQRASGGNSQKLLVDEIALRIFDKNPGSSLSFIRMIVQATIIEFQKTHHPHHHTEDKNW
jgi:hypothetical protein